MDGVVHEDHSMQKYICTISLLSLRTMYCKKLFSEHNMHVHACAQIAGLLYSTVELKPLI